MDGAKNGVDELELDLEKLSLDSSGSQMSCLVGELEKLVVDGSPPPEQSKPPGQATEKEKEVPCQQLQKEVLQQLLGVLKTPNTPERRQQILHILKNFPTLLAAFIKQRHMFQQAQVAFVNQCQTYQRALTNQVPVRIGNGSGPISVADQQKLAMMRQHLRTALSRHFDRRQPGPHHLKNNQQLLIAILKLQQKIRQVHVHRNNGSVPTVHPQKQAIAQFLRGVKSSRPATVRPVIWKKIMTLNRPDMLILYRPYHAPSVAGNLNVRKQLLSQRQQLARPVHVTKLRYQPVHKCSYQQAAEHFEPGPAAWNLGRSRGQASSSSFGTSYYASVCELQKHDSLESEEPVIIQKLS
ncbi:uncharacterized protein [Anabrus simplex]|uniref:uncharacterized protein n=1 Tax=Anabrus simplex TaxID=316456 RepID=UPI0034DD35D1